MVPKRRKLWIRLKSGGGLGSKGFSKLAECYRAGHSVMSNNNYLGALRSFLSTTKNGSSEIDDEKVPFSGAVSGYRSFVSRADSPEDVSMMARHLHCEGVSWLQEAAASNFVKAEQRHDTFSETCIHICREKLHFMYVGDSVNRIKAGGTTPYKY